MKIQYDQLIKWNEESVNEQRVEDKRENELRSAMRLKLTMNQEQRKNKKEEVKEETI